MLGRTLYLDIETAPSLGYVWAKYDTTVIDFKSDWYLLSVAYKWVGEDTKVKSIGLNNSPKYKPGSEDDKWLTEQIWNLLDQAQVVVAHNGDRFDLKKICTRFLLHGLKPPTPYKTVDTLKIARAKFAFDSNKLDDLGRYLGIGRKLPHTGFSLWKGTMAGDKKSWETMHQYNRHDVELLEEVYEIMRPWDTKHPQVNIGDISTDNCPKCGSSKIQKRGFEYTMLRKKQRWQCMSCFGWYSAGAVKV